MIPGVLPEGMQRRIPRGSTYGLTQLWTADPKGDIRQGLIRVPDELTHALPFTDKKRKFDAIVKEHLTKWTLWLAKQGWVLNSTPKVKGPYDPPSKNADSEALDGGFKWYFVTAYFKREYPLFMPTDAALWFREEAQKYGEPGMPAASVDSGEGKTAKTIWNPERVDPLDFAAKRRERLGITRDDWTQQPFDPETGRDRQVV